MERKRYYVYIMTNRYNTVLYTGVTNNLVRRVWAHKQGRGSKFTSKYRVVKLVYYEEVEDIRAAITREKQIKSGSRAKKIALIESINPTWQDLASDWFEA